MVDDDLAVVVERARIMSSPTRLALWMALEDGGRYPDDLAFEFELSKSTVSFHLAVLHRAGLVRFRQEGRRRLYEPTATRLAIITPEDLPAVTRWATGQPAVPDEEIAAAATQTAPPTVTP